MNDATVAYSVSIHIQLKRRVNLTEGQADLSRDCMNLNFQSVRPYAGHGSDQSNPLSSSAGDNGVIEWVILQKAVL